MASVPSQRPFREVLEAVNDPMFIFDVEANAFLDVNEAACEYLGYTREQLLGLTPPQIDADAEASRFPERMEELLEKGQLIFEGRHRTRDGREVPVEISARVIDSDGRRLVVSTARDITARLAGERAVQESEQLLRHIFSAIPDVITVHAPDYRVLFSNWRGSRELAEENDAVARDEPLCCCIYMGRRDRCPSCAVEQALRCGRPQRQEREGEANTVFEINAYPVTDREGGVRMVIEHVRDITPLRQLEQEFRQSQKMEAVGQLAGGVAHDFRNQLTVIQGYCDLLLGESHVPDSLLDALGEIRSAAERAGRTTNQLLAFSRRQKLDPRVLSFNDVLRQMQNPLAKMIGEDVRLTLDLDPDLGFCRMDQAHLEQALVNLVINARDAMLDGGRLRLVTQNVFLDGASIPYAAQIEPGPYVMLAVRDNGVGMDEQTRRQAFEPFFTTKSSKGTGLGLSMVYGFVKQSGGVITIDSAPGCGTTFAIYQPRGDSPAEQAVESSAAALPRGEETILLAEDDPAVRQVVVRFLRSAGYNVLEATSGSEAIPIGEHYEGTIALMITDVVMPGESGPQLASRLRQARPEMKILFMTGYADRLEELKAAAASNRHVLQKPFSPEEMVRRVREILDE